MPNKISKGLTNHMENPTPQTYDLCVIGGGIQGAGVAQAAALSGLSVALMEKSDWGAGTSSKSSKLIHGGLRYLQTLQIGLVYESLRERRILLDIAEDIVKPNWFYLPVYKTDLFKAWQVRIGLILYRLLAGRNNLAGFKQLPREQWHELEGLNTSDLDSVFIYQDAQTDDKILTQRVVASAEQHGATLLCPAKFLSAEENDNGYLISFAIDDQISSLQCRTLVNAAGPWINRIAETIEPKPPTIDVDLIKGTHLEFTQKLSEKCFYIEAKQDHRAIFVLPFKGGTLLGTTEQLFEGNPDGVEPSEEETAYLLEIIHSHFPHFNHQPSESWAGLRVLPASGNNPFQRSREVQFAETNNYLAIYGGKLTGYRATAENALKKILKSMLLEANQAEPSAQIGATKKRDFYKIGDTSKVKI
jgi:glycerol-3-phosphate dehydrogenase